jgi:hypothetical protein
MATMSSTESAAENAVSDSIAEAWATFRKHLAARIREINEEVAHYPTPIARCDEQLTKLLEQRARVFRQENVAAELGPMPLRDPDWLRRVRDYVTNLEPCGDDDIETALRSRLLNSMTQARR